MPSDSSTLQDVKQLGIKAFFACQSRIPSWFHPCLWIVGGCLRNECPKDIDCMVDSSLPIHHLAGGKETNLGGVHIPSSTLGEVPLDLWRLSDRGDLERYLRTVPLNIQSIAYNPIINHVEERGYLQCIKTKTLDLMPDAHIFLQPWDFVDKVRRIQRETHFRLSKALQDYVDSAPPNPNPNSSWANYSSAPVSNPVTAPSNQSRTPSRPSVAVVHTPFRTSF